MGWHLNAIIIKDPGALSDQEILNKFFEANFLDIGLVNFDYCIYPQDDETMFFGNYKGNLIISTLAYDLVEKFFTKEISKAEKIILDLFPHSEIGAFMLNSSMNYYSWTFLSNGQKIRTKQGDADNGITCDFGEPLPEEEEFLKLSVKDKKGNVTYNWPRKNGQIDVYTEDQIGENYVSRIWARFTGTELFTDEELMNDIDFRGFKIIEKEIEVEEPLSGKKTLWQRLFGAK